jgi:hypothetical protein
MFVVLNDSCRKQAITLIEFFALAASAYIPDNFGSV